MERAKATVSRALRPVLAAFVVVSLNAASPEVRGAPTGDELALELRDNVVAIIAEWQNGETHEGFGFFAGERDGQLLIATANHLVRGTLPDEFATTINIEFYSRQGQKFSGELVGTSDSSRDLAVLQVPLPQGLTWRKDVVSDKGAQRLMSVWFVGRARNWYVPSTPGKVNEIGLDDRIVIDDLNVRVGTSGAPLIAESGIVGMVVTEEGGISYAVSIEFIERAFGHWNHPWQLTALESKARPPSPPTLSYKKEQQTALVVPPKTEVAIDPIEAKYVTIRNANVREEPTVKSAKVTTLKRGAEVHVAGKVKDKNWYLVERDDRTLGYVFGDLLLDVETARQQELSFWESIKGSDNAKTFEAYLEQYPDGLFAGVARVRIEELTQQAAQPAAQARASDSQVAKTAPASETPADAPFGSAEEVLRHLKKNEEAIRRKFTSYNRKTDAVESLYGSTIVDIYKFDVREIAGDTVSVFMIFAAGSRQAAGGTRTSQINELVVQLRWRDGAFEFVGHRRP